MSESLIGAVVANPKTGEPFFCVIDSPSTDGRWSNGLYLRDFDGALRGSGYFETDHDSSYFLSAEHTQYPRFHTPEGVRRRGVGDGTCLYTVAACAVAVLRERSRRELSFDDWPVVTGLSNPKAGISSTQERSKAATAWWSKAVELDLAEEDAVDASKRENVDDCRYNKAASRVARSVFELDVDDDGDNDLSLCLSGYYSTATEIDVNILKYRRAYENNLVVGSLLNPIEWGADRNDNYQSSTVMLDKPPTWIDFNAEVARAVNVGVFRTYEYPDDTFMMWTKLCIASGVDEQAIASMRERFNEGYDIQPSSMMGYDDPRKNPSKPNPRTKVDPFAGIIKSYAPPVQRRNPSTPRAAAAQSLLEERVRLGWPKFSALP